MGGLGVPSGSERDPAHSLELIRQGQVGFVSIPAGINIVGVHDVIGRTPSKTHAIVDCSQGNHVLSDVQSSFGYAQYGERYFDQFRPGGIMKSHGVSQPETIGPKNVMDGADLDMRSEGEKRSHQELLRECQDRIGEVELF